MFYLGTHDVLQEFNPFLKFVMIKLVIFLSFWQSVLFAALVCAPVLPRMKPRRLCSPTTLSAAGPCSS